MLGTSTLYESRRRFNRGNSPSVGQYKITEFGKKVRSPSVCRVNDCFGTNGSTLSLDCDPALGVSR
jgi:hypothetical protein